MALDEETQDRHAKYKHLLEPIKNLTDVWGISIANELEEYIDTLDTITISFDGEEGVNFAEAAMLIQNSACVYSKKVELLYKLIYGALDMIFAKRNRKQKNSSIDDKNGQDADVEATVEEEFLLLDDIVREGKNVQMRAPRGAMRAVSLVASGRKLPANTPRRAVEATHSNRRQKTPLSRLSAKRTDHARGAEAFQLGSCQVDEGTGALLLAGGDADPLASLGDAPGAFDDDEAMMLMGAGAGAHLGGSGSSGAFVPGGAAAAGAADASLGGLAMGPSALLRDSAVQAAGEGAQGTASSSTGGGEDNDMDLDGGFGGGFGDADMGGIGGGFEDDVGAGFGSGSDPFSGQQSEDPWAAAAAAASGSQTQQGGAAAAGAGAGRPRRARKAARASDPWAILDVDAPQGRERKLRRGKTFHVPKNPSMIARHGAAGRAHEDADILLGASAGAAGGGGILPGNKGARAAAALRTSGILALGGADCSGTSVSVTRAAPLFPELAGVFEQDRKLAARARMKAALAGEAGQDQGHGAGGEDGEDPGMAYADGGDDDYDDYGGGFGDADMGGVGGGFEDDVGAGFGSGDADEAALGAGDLVGMGIGGAGDGAAGEGEGEGYEALVRRHVAEFQRGAEKYVRRSDLALRVAAWEERVVPVLEEEKRRPAFDIHGYGRDIVGRLSEGAAREGLLLGEQEAREEQARMRALGVEQDEADEEAALADPAVALLAGGEEQAPEGGRVVAVDFGAVVSKGSAAGESKEEEEEQDELGVNDGPGSSVHEVCRCFLASLMLANAGAVRLCHPGAADRPADPVDAGSRRFRMQQDDDDDVPSSFAHKGQFMLRWTGRGGADDGIADYRAPSAGGGEAGALQAAPAVQGTTEDAAALLEDVNEALRASAASSSHSKAAKQSMSKSKGNGKRKGKAKGTKNQRKPTRRSSRRRAAMEDDSEPESDGEQEHKEEDEEEEEEDVAAAGTPSPAPRARRAPRRARGTAAAAAAAAAASSPLSPAGSPRLELDDLDVQEEVDAEAGGEDAALAIDESVDVEVVSSAGSKGRGRQSVGQALTVPAAAAQSGSGATAADDAAAASAPTRAGDASEEQEASSRRTSPYRAGGRGRGRKRKAPEAGMGEEAGAQQSGREEATGEEAANGAPERKRAKAVAGAVEDEDEDEDEDKGGEPALSASLSDPDPAAMVAALDREEEEEEGSKAAAAGEWSQSQGMGQPTSAGGLLDESPDALRAGAGLNTSLVDIAGRMAAARQKNRAGGMDSEDEDEDEDEDDIFDSLPDMAKSVGPRAVSLYSARAKGTGTTGGAGGKRQSRVFRHSIAGGAMGVGVGQGQGQHAASSSSSSSSAAAVHGMMGSSSIEDAQAELERSVLGMQAVESLDAAGRTSARPVVKGKAVSRGGALGRRRRQSAAAAATGGPPRGLARSDSVNSTTQGGRAGRAAAKAAAAEVGHATGRGSASASQQSLASDMD